ncbi:hypothetical protein HDV00_011192 [Rhizophlyctis rosea]|nr:hypothetical protein HDV00_011192 [Rhizophlyctis rosea]
MTYFKSFIEPNLPELPPGILQHVARLAGPISSRKIRNQSKKTRKVVTEEDLVWAEAGWRYHHWDTPEECYQWAIDAWHTTVLWAYMHELPPAFRINAFHHAAHRGDEGMLTRMLDEVKINHALRGEHFSLGPLHPRRADDDPDEDDTPTCTNSHAHIVKILLERGATDGSLHQFHFNGVDFHGSDRTYPSQRAIQLTSDPDIIRSLLDKKGYLRGDLLLPITDGNPTAIKLLLKAGAIIDDEGEYLNEAAETGNVEIVKLLIEYRADVHADTHWGCLYKAVEGGSVDVVKVLLEAGADVDGYTESPLLTAVGKGYTDIVRALVEAGANVHHPLERDHEPAEALFTAAACVYVDVVEILIRAGGDVHRGEEGAVWVAAGNGHVGVVQALLEAGANVRSQSSKFDQLKQRREKLIAVVAVLDHHCASDGDIVISADGKLPRGQERRLWEAAETGQVDKVKSLLKGGGVEGFFKAGGDDGSKPSKFEELKQLPGKLADVVALLERHGAGG